MYNSNKLGSLLGECRNMLESEVPIQLKTRNEVEFDSNIDAPIRIHKYNLHKKSLKEADADYSSEEDYERNPSDLLQESLDNIQNQNNDNYNGSFFITTILFIF